MSPQAGRGIPCSSVPPHPAVTSPGHSISCLERDAPQRQIFWAAFKKSNHPFKPFLHISRQTTQEPSLVNGMDPPFACCTLRSALAASPVPQHSRAELRTTAELRTVAIPSAGGCFLSRSCHGRSPRDGHGAGSWCIAPRAQCQPENGAQAGTVLLRSCQVQRQEGRKETGTRQRSTGTTEASRKMGLQSHSSE